MDYTSITLDRDPRVAWITLNRPEKLNALNKRLLEELDHALESLAVSDNRVVVIRGAGRAFSAGYDISKSEGSSDGDYTAEKSPVEDYDQLVGYMDLFLKIWRHPQPVITAVHGICAAGATQLCTFSDITIVSEDARIQASPSLPLGGGFISPLWSHLVGPKRAKLMSFDAGRVIDGRTASDWGWATECVPAEGFDDYIKATAESIARTPAAVLRMKKVAVNRAAELEGFLTLVRMGAETDAILHMTPEVRQMSDNIRRLGLKGAIAEFNKVGL